MRNKNRGISLIEIILAVAISTMIILIIGRLTDISSIVNNIIDQTIKVRQGSDYTLQTLITDIRSMGPSSLGAYPIEAASSTSFTFYSDVDRDGLMERVRYFTTTSTLDKGTIKPAGNPLVYNPVSEIIITAITNVDISQSNFEYFDQNFTGSQAPLVAPIDVQIVRSIKIVVAVKSSTSTSSVVKFSNIITPRNLKSN